MNVSQILQRIRDQVDDPIPVASRTYSDLEIIRHVDEQLRQMYRTMMTSSLEWSNLCLGLSDANKRTLFTDTFEWRLPTWIEKVVKVYRRNPTDATTELTFSPYNWTSTPNQLGMEIPKTDPGRRSGWSWEGNHTFRVWNWNQSLDLILLCATLPPPVFKATLTAAHGTPSDTALYLPAAVGASDLGDFLSFAEEGRHVNAEIEVVGTADAADLKLGEVRRCIYSKVVDDSGTRRHELKFDAAFSSVFAVGDTVETRIPIPEIHTRLLILKVVNACAVKKFNTDLQRSIGAEMGLELGQFAEYAKGPRDSSGPFFKTRGTRVGASRYDPDRYPRYGW